MLQLPATRAVSPTGKATLYQIINLSAVFLLTNTVQTDKKQVM